MKNKFLLALILVTAFVFNGCDDDEDPSGVRGHVTASVSNVSPAFFDLLTLEDSYIKFTVDLKEEDRDKINEVFIEASYNGKKEKTEYSKVTNFPTDFTVTAVDLANKLGINFDDLSLGDFFTLEVVVEEKDGKQYRSKAFVMPNIACASDLAGVYTLEATGVGGGGLDLAEPWTSSIETAKIESKDGGVTYTIEPALGGIMVDFYSDYGATTVVGEFQDICGSIKNPVAYDGWNDIVTYSGSIDSETGVISIYFVNDWGDYGNMTLTPQ
jgi:hypothetical protein